MTSFSALRITTTAILALFYDSRAGAAILSYLPGLILLALASAWAELQPTGRLMITWCSLYLEEEDR